MCTAKCLFVCIKVLFYVRQGSLPCAKCPSLCNQRKRLICNLFRGYPQPRCSFVCRLLLAFRQTQMNLAGKDGALLCAEHRAAHGGLAVPEKVLFHAQLARRPYQRGKARGRMRALWKGPLVFDPVAPVRPSTGKGALLCAASCANATANAKRCPC